MVDRYYPDSYAEKSWMEKDELGGGDWVSYTDYQKLEQRIAELEQERHTYIELCIQKQHRMFELEKAITELTNNHVCERCREFSQEKEHLRKSISKLEAMINVAKIDMDKDKKLRSFTNKLYRFKNASMSLTFDTIDEYIAAKTALYDLVKELIDKGDNHE